MRRIKAILGLGLLLCCTPLPFSTTAHAQMTGGRVSFGGHLGLSKYWGTFTDDRFWYSGDLYSRWNIVSRLSLIGQFGLGELQYRVSEVDILQYPDYFGNPEDTHYPNTGNTVNREDINVIRTNTYSLLAAFNLLPEERVSPYGFVGVGLLNFNARNQSQGFGLPNNAAEAYDRNVLVIPVGIGFEFFATSSLTINGKAQLNLTTTDYLDDYDNGGSNDVFGSFGLGIGYYVFGNVDCDGDGLTDSEEKSIGTEPCVEDTDLDGLDDFTEKRKTGTDPLKADTDDDGLNDFREVRETGTDPRNPDSDNDGLNDGQELSRKTDPRNPDTDGDGLNDGDEVNIHKTDPLLEDTDKDGLFDGPEINQYGTSPTKRDSDGDELTDGEEVKTYKTNPAKEDTDGDGLTDGQEIREHLTDPRKIDTDDDKLTDKDEITRVKTNPLDPDTDADDVIDGLDKCPLVRGVKERNGCPAPPKVGTITNFPDIYFIVDTDRFDFTRPETDENLAKMLQYIQQCDGLEVLIEGHASREGPDTRNQELSEMRAERVKNWLIEKGVDPGHISGTTGYGSRRNAVPEPKPGSKEAKEMDPEELEAIRKQNRRIAIRVMKTCDQ